MLAALIIALVIIGVLIGVTIALANSVSDKERDVDYYKNESKSYQDRYWNNDRRESFEIEKERKEHESKLRIAEASAYAQQRVIEAEDLAELRLAELDGESRLEIKKRKRLTKYFDKCYKASSEELDSFFGLGNFSPTNGPDGDLSAADFPQPEATDPTSTPPPFPEAASTNEA